MIAHNREDGGKIVRMAWIAWAHTQPAPKPSWLAPWEELSEPDKEADRQIWDATTGPYRALEAQAELSVQHVKQWLRTMPAEQRQMVIDELVACTLRTLE